MEFNYNHNINILSPVLTRDFLNLIQDTQINNTFSEPPFSSKWKLPNLLSLFNTSKLNRPIILQGITGNTLRCKISMQSVTNTNYFPPYIEKDSTPSHLTCGHSSIVDLIFCYASNEFNYADTWNFVPNSKIAIFLR